MHYLLIIKQYEVNDAPTGIMQIYFMLYHFVVKSLQTCTEKLILLVHLKI